MIILLYDWLLNVILHAKDVLRGLCLSFVAYNPGRGTVVKRIKIVGLIFGLLASSIREANPALLKSGQCPRSSTICQPVEVGIVTKPRSVRSRTWPRRLFVDIQSPVMLWMPINGDVFRYFIIKPSHSVLV